MRLFKITDNTHKTTDQNNKIKQLDLEIEKYKTLYDSLCAQKGIDNFDRKYIDPNDSFAMINTLLEDAYPRTYDKITLDKRIKIATILEKLNKEKDELEKQSCSFLSSFNKLFC